MFGYHAQTLGHEGFQLNAIDGKSIFAKVLIIWADDVEESVLDYLGWFGFAGFHPPLAARRCDIGERVRIFGIDKTHVIGEVVWVDAVGCEGLAPFAIEAMTNGADLRNLSAISPLSLNFHFVGCD
jgi:hypothetical protein